MENLYWLDQIHPSQRAVVGNQAFILSQLSQRDYPVVPGFVVPAIAFWEFIESLGELEPMLADLPYSSFHVDVDNPRQLQQVAQQIRREMTKACLPPAWTSLLLTAAEMVQAPAMIFHPSLSLPSRRLQVSRLTVEGLNPGEVTTSLANTLQSYDLEPYGILESHSCPNQPEALELALKQVWAELFRARSLFYWQRNSIGLQQLSLAVLVQPLWEARASGTLLVNPSECSIQATWGNGEALTKGEVLPDYYQIQVGTDTVKTQSLGSKTRAYRLNNPRESSSLSTSTLQAYLLTEEEQKQYALEEKYLQQLIGLSQRLAAEFSLACSLEWTLYQTPGSPEPQLYLTRFIPQLRSENSVPSMSTQPQVPSITPQLVRGLPAAPGQVTAPAQVIMGERQNLEAMLPGRILVTQSLAPEWLPWLRQAAGVITEQGGMTSHAAIIARELGLPAVVGVVGVTQLIQTGELIRVDGDQGEVHRVKDLSSETELPRQLHSLPMRPPIATQLMVNVSQPISLERIVGLPIDGVGLLRSELMMLDALENRHPSEWLRQGLKSELVARLAQLIIHFAAAFAPRPVFYRSLDWRSHEFQFLSGQIPSPVAEVNPILGLRGTRRYLLDPTYFDLELTALVMVQAQGYTNVQLMLPFVRTVEEFTFCRRRVEQAGLTDNPYFQLWIMAEVPSVLFLLPDYVKAGVQGISIGSNDLTQLLLATDRDQEQLGPKLDARHPAVKRAIEQLIQGAKTAGIPCSICGQAPAQYPELIDLLVRWGITSVSVDINDVEQTYMAIARAEQRLLIEAARRKIDDN
ncbi:MAG TPA: response regulator [Cyanobacteria bacterium UBA8543]|nr:response regulator [Cyanobacteria bacterium UBA8543]